MPLGDYEVVARRSYQPRERLTTRTTSTVVLNTEFEDRPLDLGWLAKTDKTTDTTTP